MKGANGLWHPCTELDHPGVHSVWSQVIEFPEVELRHLQKRSWRVVVSQKWKFDDDVLLREARALLRGLQVMVCAEHVRNARVLCLTDIMSCVETRKLTSLSVFVIRLNFTSDVSQVKATVPLTLPDDMTCPSMLRVTSQITCLTVLFLHESVTYGEEETMSARPSACSHFEPESTSRRDNAEPLENTCLDKTDQEEIRSNATTSEEKAGAPVCRKRRRLIANRTVAPSVTQLHAVSNSDRHQASHKVLQHLVGKHSARCGRRRGRRGARVFLQREVLPEKQQLGWRHSAWSDVPLLPGVRERRRTLLATQLWCPPGLEAPQSAQEQVSSRVTRYFTPRSPLSILRRSIQVPLQGISHRHQALLHPKYRPLRFKAYAAIVTLELRCLWCTSLPMTGRALGLGSPTVRVFNFNHHNFLVEWNTMIEETRLQDSLQPSMP